MINLLPIHKVISAIAVLYAAVACLILWCLYDPSVSLWGALAVATGGSTVLSLGMFVLLKIYWQRLWDRFPRLNSLLFPNLNGTWEMEIHWSNNGEEGVAQATAVITQDFLKIAMDVDSKDSESQTLMAKPKKDPESGRPTLYYVYLTTPKENSKTSDKTPYKGAAILQIGIANINHLSGNYFTSRRTAGRYELSRAEI